jgi:O-6-methylguanine DNA methyltransferase
MKAATIPTPDGVFTAWFSERGLAHLDFPVKAGAAAPSPATPPLTREQRGWLKATTRALRAVLQGQTPDEFPPLDVSAGTEFQQQVWEELCRIGSGETRGYGEIARAVGRPAASRAVGQACGANPIPLLIPCHRVLAANRKLGGFSGGLEWKRRLLTREGRTFA